ncbi:hypothetical protein RHSIM_Rhsim10G0198000 [Rhododendron simsii]|uniref:GRIP domain-containing protein n=1 Tax=Rhododendron simsii TaxID=118357 RepID=A0A834GAZ1_RHOSS|nr:hypothetical protein RHSIM_Rhsim10G0198000 [Rhododendron simsii]
MSVEGGNVGGMLENNAEDGVKPDGQLNGMSQESGETTAKENGHPSTSDTQDHLVQIVVDLNFQNEYLKSQFEVLKNLHSESSESNQQKMAIERDGGGLEDVKELREKIESLSRELLEEKQTRGAAEEALKHLRAVFSEADAKSQELSAKLVEAQQKLEEEIKERDEKYSELDSKFNRLHKRAKQRIQEVQKEKDDIEAQFQDLKEKADRASTQQSSLQQELERTRQQANDALKAIDVLARQQAQREEELAQSQRHILALQEEIEELERENRLHSQQEALLKEELRNMERMKRREGVDMTYLKNVIVKLLQTGIEELSLFFENVYANGNSCTGEVEALLPVVGMLLQFSPEEIQKCQQAYRSSKEVPPSPASAASDTSSSGLSLFPRFSFS